jgi:hypothetical protein
MDEKTYIQTQRALEHEAKEHQRLDGLVSATLPTKQKLMAQEQENHSVLQVRSFLHCF